MECLSNLTRPPSTCCDWLSRTLPGGMFVLVHKLGWRLFQDRIVYVTYRYPNLKTIRELIYKRGYGKVDRRRTPLTDNSIIEEVRKSDLLLCVTGFEKTLLMGFFVKLEFDVSLISSTLELTHLQVLGRLRASL